MFKITNNLNISSGNHNYTVSFSFEKFEFDTSFNLGAYGFGAHSGCAGAFGGDFDSLVTLGLCVYEGLFADASIAA